MSEFSISRHPDFIVIPVGCTFGIGNTPLENDLIFEGLQVMEEVETLSLETRRMLEEICSQVSEIVEDIAGDFGDAAADLEELI